MRQICDIYLERLLSPDEGLLTRGVETLALLCTAEVLIGGSSGSESESESESESSESDLEAEGEEDVDDEDEDEGAFFFRSLVFTFFV